MSSMNNFDLNLLRVFDAVWRHGHLGLASKELELSQPALSHALRRLREGIGDPLFVKVSKGMQPSARAVQLAPIVQSILASVREQVLAAPAFDPKHASRSFTIALVDVGEMAFLPKLLGRLMCEAPSVDVRSVSMPPPGAGACIAEGGGRSGDWLFPGYRRYRFSSATPVPTRLRLPRARRASLGPRHADEQAIPRPAACGGADRGAKSGNRRAVFEATGDTQAETAALTAFPEHPDGHRIDGPRRHGAATHWRSVWADRRTAGAAAALSDPVLRYQAVLASLPARRSGKSMAAQHGRGSAGGVIATTIVYRPATFLR